MIEAKSLCKSYGIFKAVDELSFKVEAGQVLGFLGPNGAGKSTTMKMLTGFLAPTSGTALINGVDVVENPVEARKNIGYLPEGAPSYGEMTVHQFLVFVARARLIRKSEVTASVDRVIQKLNLANVKHQVIETLSKGFKRRVGLAQAIIHDPQILILDEPTDGLDPNQKREVRNLIRRMGEEKVIIFSTHILEEVDAVCSRAIIIDQGKIVADGSPEELRGRSKGAGAVRVKINGMAGSGIRSELSSLGGVAEVEEIKSSELGFEGRALPAKASASISEAIFNLCKDRGWILEELHVEEGRLDEVFREITVAETKLAKAS